MSRIGVGRLDVDRGRWPQVLNLNLKEPQQRTLRYAALLGAMGLLLLVVTGGHGRNEPAQPSRPETVAVMSAAATEADLVARMEAGMARDLEQILQGVQGAGRVSVRVSLAGALMNEFAVDQTSNRTTTQEHDRNGGSRVVTRAEESGRVVSIQSAGGQEALIRQIRRPEVRGVLIVAQGADNPAVRVSLTRAAQAALDAPLYRITVLPGKRAEGSER